MSLDILVVDDEVDIRDLVSEVLRAEGFSARGAANSTQVFDAIAEKIPSAIILDIWLQGSDLDGLGILEIVKKRYPLMPVVVISGHGTIETAVSAIKIGAYDYIEKPFTHEKLLIVLKRAVENSRLRRENIDLKSKVVDRSELVGASQPIIKLKAEIEKVSPTSGRVMLAGAAGTGKELIARLIHKKSKRMNAPFIVFTPTGMSLDRIKQELFGEPERKDTNGGFIKRTSILEAANNGTLYIDEIADLPLPMQQMLLKFVHDQSFERPGTGKVTKLDVRLISATSHDLESDIALGKFRQDLFYRLNVVPMKIPTLSERKEDIPQLVQFFVKQLAKFAGLKERDFAEDALAALQSYNWPGNIRQLRNVIEWTLIMNPVQSGEATIIKAEMLPPEILNTGVTIYKPESSTDMMSMPLREAREVFERQYLSAQMSRFNNNISKTSSFVGMERSALHRKLKLLNIHAGGDKRLDEYDDEDEIIDYA